MPNYRDFDELRDYLLQQPGGPELLREERLATIRDLLAYESEEVNGGNPPDQARIGVLRTCIEALGGHLELAAVFDEKRILIAI